MAPYSSLDIHTDGSLSLRLPATNVMDLTTNIEIEQGAAFFIPSLNLHVTMNLSLCLSFLMILPLVLLLLDITLFMMATPRLRHPYYANSSILFFIHIMPLNGPFSLTFNHMLIVTT